MFSSRDSKINSLKWLPEFTNSSSMVAQIYQSLLNYWKLNIYLVYKNNFFTNIKFFKQLKKYRIGICNTVQGFQ